MLKIVSAFGNDIGTSIVIKTKVKKIIKELNVVAVVEVATESGAHSLVGSSNIIITASHKAKNFPKGKAEIIPIENMLDDNELKTKLKKIILKVETT